MRLYRSLVNLETDSFGAAILRDYPNVEPYAPLALKQLAFILHSRLIRIGDNHRELRSALADSASSLWFALMDRYPDSRTALHTLRRFRILDGWAGKGAHESALRKLNGLHPGTRVDAEVKRQLALIDKPQD